MNISNSEEDSYLEFLMPYKIAFFSFVKICSVKPWAFILHCRSAEQNKKYILSDQILSSFWPHFKVKTLRFSELESYDIFLAGTLR